MGNPNGGFYATKRRKPMASITTQSKIDDLVEIFPGVHVSKQLLRDRIGDTPKPSPIQQDVVHDRAKETIDVLKTKAVTGLRALGSAPGAAWRMSFRVAGKALTATAELPEVLGATGRDIAKRYQEAK